MATELFVSECENCEFCVGRLHDGCPRYAYWGEESSTGFDCPHYTGRTEDELRKLAAGNPGGSADAAVRAADGKPRLR